LIKNLDALETCGMLSDVITGKTGVLTEANMKVLKVFSGETLQNAQSSELNQQVQSLIEELIILNSSARLDINDEALRYEPSGNPVDVAMLNHLFENHVDVPAKM
jgi:magnesium-transporting ATPase (P-type)